MIAGAFIGTALLASAQSNNSGNPTKKSPAQLRGSGQYHGSKDTTPGSPMGTGGAGGGEMSGSTKGSALETAEHAEKADTQTSKQGLIKEPEQSGRISTKKKTAGKKSRGKKA